MEDFHRIINSKKKDKCSPLTFDDPKLKPFSGLLDSITSDGHAHVGGASPVIGVGRGLDAINTCHSEADLKKYGEGLMSTKIRKIKSDSNLKKKKSVENLGSEDCDSDTSSICSEHSTKPTRTGYKRMRKGWKKCPVHSKGPRHSKEQRAAKREQQRHERESAHFALVNKSVIFSKLLPDTKDYFPSKEDIEACEESDLICTCVIVTKPRSKPRPEPEGGQCLTTFKDEYDRIIYGSDPIFSDTEDNPSMDEQVQQEMGRYHKRTASNPDIFATAMMVTSNTMLKFAIIQAELKNLIQGALKRVCLCNLKD